MSIYKLSTEKITKNKPTRHYSSKQEKSVAKAVGGKTTANSGATPWQKGDITSDKVLYECKTCTKDQASFSIKKEWIEKNKQEMVFMDKDYSVIVFNFGPGQENYYIIDELTFQELIEYIESK